VPFVKTLHSTLLTIDTFWEGR